MTAPLFFLVNPVAGDGRARGVWRAARDEARRLGLAYEFEETRAPLTGISFVRQALRAGARIVAAIGGDGTVHEAVNGFFLNRQAIAEDAALLVIPAGRSADFARNLGMPGGVAALSLLKEGRVARLDLAEASFVDTAGVRATRVCANGARIGGAEMPMPAPPRFASMGWTGKMTVDDGDELVLYARWITVALGPSVGGVRVAPRAKMDDGLLDVVIEDPPSGLPADLAAPGARTDEPDARGRRVVLSMDVTPSDEAPSIELDGQRAGSGSVELDVLPSALGVYVRRP